MNCTFAGEVGGSVARVDGGNVRVGSPGAPGWTTTGAGGADCCAESSENNPAIPAIPAIIAAAISQLRHLATLITYLSLDLPLKRGDVINVESSSIEGVHINTKRALEAFAP